MKREPVKPEKVVKETKRYTIELIVYTDDTICLRRTNDGYNIMELLGVLDIGQSELRGSVLGVKLPKVDVIERQVIKDVKK